MSEAVTSSGSGLFTVVSDIDTASFDSAFSAMSSNEAVTALSSVSVLTTLVQTIEESISQPATTFTTTTVQTILVTDPVSYSSLLASETKSAKATTAETTTSFSITPTPASTPTALTTPSSKPALALILGLVLGILACFILACLIALYLIKKKRRKLNTLRSHDVHLPATGTVSETTADQINQAVEARYAAEKASRMVQITAQPIDTISIDSREHGRATVVETIPDQHENQMHQRSNVDGGPAAQTFTSMLDSEREQEARDGFGPMPQFQDRPQR